MGHCLEGALRGHGYHVTLEDSYPPAGTGRRPVDLIIATNTSLSCHTIQRMIPNITLEYPGVRIIVLSGYFTEEWVVDLRQKGMDEFFELPYDENALLRGLSGLLARPRV